MIYRGKTYKHLATGMLVCVMLIVTLLFACKKIEPVRIIKVKTEGITNIQFASSLAQGILIDIADGSVSQHGHCWSTSDNPTINNSRSMLGSRQTTGSFQSQLEELTPGTVYYVRAYGQSGDLVFYGESKSFTTTSGNLPTITTLEVTSTTTNSAQCGGQITSDGGYPILARGVCWNTTGSPTPEENSTKDGTGTGNFTSKITGLIANTKYYVKAYATNELGTILGNEKEFTTTTSSNLPVVNTLEVTSITMNSAQCGGEITSEGGSAILARGVCWNTTGSPTPEENSTKDGTGTGSFTSEITGLTENTKYFVKAYATNESGTNLGDEIIFTTSYLPSVSTVEINNIKPSSVTCVGNVTDAGGTELSARGFCWDVDPSPSIDGTHSENGTETGEFTGTLTELSSATEYYIRAYATNINGTEYGDEFTVITPFTDTRDFKTYPVAHIGDQYWMAENLNYGNYIPTTANQYDNGVVEKYCIGNNEDNCQLYGGYYTWPEMMQYNLTESVQGVCPSGWHLPSDEEWKALEMALGMSQAEADVLEWRGTNEGGKLKLAGTDYWVFPNEGATNETGFSALPGGYYDVITNIDFVGYTISATFWTSTIVGEFNAYYRYLEYTTGQIYRWTGYQGNSAPVRCVKD